MFWKFIEKIGNLKLAVYLLCGAGLSFFWGSLTAQSHFELFRGLNSARVQDWLMALSPDKMHLTWWMYCLFFFCFLLGVNTIACLMVRLRALIPKYGTLPFKKFTLLLAPSLIHLLFAGVLLGHGVTFTTGQWINVPTKMGDTVRLPDGSASFMVADISYTYYDDTTAMKGRIKQITLALKGDGKTELQLAMPGYSSFNGWHLLLKMDKKKKVRIDPSDEACNKAPLYQKKARKKRASLYIRMVKDPGLPFITISFILILILLLWYYVGGKAITEK